MLKNMDKSILGIWVAHGEGRFKIEDKNICIPIQYIDYDNEITQNYPHNPNGSDLATAALCSENGRHLAMMPHPERCFLEWQKPIITKYDNLMSPWFLLFRNAYNWCCDNN
jgi:phosphoribosylformylglycinamidine synthase